MVDYLSHVLSGHSPDEDAEPAGASASRHQRKWALAVAGMLILGIQFTEAEDFTKALGLR
ncbi:hypothetical protein [Streptomyces clavifer]|uniref:hypothetical protein n=1 Tax=Streptomyces clavifer TaxID=68188 RepID=UPI003649EADA